MFFFSVHSNAKQDFYILYYTGGIEDFMHLHFFADS